MDWKQLTKDIHQNAVEHGWWETERPAGEVIALIHSEWSEALEEYRHERGLEWEHCANSKGCDEADSCDEARESCTGYIAKPEGIAVELADGVIRILDWFAWLGIEYEGPKKLLPKMFRKDEFPLLIAMLHSATADSLDCGVMGDDTEQQLSACINIVNTWLMEQGVELEKVILRKHEFNKSRARRHGGLKC